METDVKKLKDKTSSIFYKSIYGQFKADVVSRKVSGYFSSFNTIDSDYDIIRPGAFAKSIAERGVDSTGNRKIKYLHQHRVDEISGPLLVLKEDENGLYFEGEIEKTSLGDIILERYKNQTYREHSFGFNYMWDKCDWIQMPNPNSPTKEMMDVFECKELNLFEGSVVTFGANSNTPFMGFKGATQAECRKELEDELNFLLKHSPNYEYELRIRQLYQKQFSLAKILAAQSTKEASKPKGKGFDWSKV